MKKVIYALIFSMLFFNISNYTVKAEEFDYNKCTLNCANAGDNKACKASCDARRFIEEKKQQCEGNTSCETKWENAYSIKYSYFLDYYNGKSSDGDFDYSNFDYDECWLGCRGAGEYRLECKSKCEARKEVQTCILDSFTEQQVKSCKGQYEKIFQEKLQGNGVVEPPEEDNEVIDNEYQEMLEYCNEKCSKQCENDQNNGCSRACYEECTSKYGKTYSKIQCGDSEIPYIIPQIVRTVILILQIGAPIIVIIIGSLDFVKAIIAQKDDEIKKGQHTFLRRLLLGACVFLVFFIVEIVIGLVAPEDDKESMWKCVDCFINGECEKKW